MAQRRNDWSGRAGSDGSVATGRGRMGGPIGAVRGRMMGPFWGGRGRMGLKTVLFSELPPSGMTDMFYQANNFRFLVFSNFGVLLNLTSTEDSFCRGHEILQYKMIKVINDYQNVKN